MIDWRQSTNYQVEQAALDPEAWPVYEILCDDYRQAQINRGRHPFVNYTILADLVRWGWTCPARVARKPDHV